MEQNIGWEGSEWSESLGVRGTQNGGNHWVWGDQNGASHWVCVEGVWNEPNHQVSPQTPCWVGTECTSCPMGGSLFFIGCRDSKTTLCFTLAPATSMVAQQLLHAAHHPTLLSCRRTGQQRAMARGGDGARGAGSGKVIHVKGARGEEGLVGSQRDGCGGYGGAWRAPK